MTLCRTATLGDVEQALDWAAAEGWNPGLEDATAFFAADADGFFVAVEAETPVAAISVVNHSDSFAFLGLYIVIPSFRGQGIGFDLWRHAVQHAGRRTIGLDGVPDQQANYAASGFQHAGSTVRYVGQVDAATSASIRLARAADIPGMISAEAHLSGVRKDAYLTAWFTNTETRKTLMDDGGFCTIRRCRGAAKIGPLVADDPVVAERLLRHAASIFGDYLSIDVPEHAPELADLCVAMGLSPGFQTARMYRGTSVLASPGVYAVTSLELG